MQDKTNFWLTWPSIIIFIPFLLFLGIKLLLAIIFPGPPELVMVRTGLQIWVVSFLAGSAVFGIFLFGLYRLMPGAKGGRESE
ncbi:MAG: hypothetical protein ABR533_11495 [Desulfonatronovibrio sp.]